MTQHMEIPVAASDWISSNDRHHRMDDAGRTKRLRQIAGLIARKLRPVGKLSEVVAYVSYPTNRKADPPNAGPTLKAILDGIVDAGILDDDDSAHIRRTSFERGPNTSTPQHYSIRLEMIP